MDLNSFCCHFVCFKLGSHDHTFTIKDGATTVGLASAVSEWKSNRGLPAGSQSRRYI